MTRKKRPSKRGEDGVAKSEPSVREGTAGPVKSRPSRKRKGSPAAGRKTPESAARRGVPAKAKSSTAKVAAAEPAAAEPAKKVSLPAFGFAEDLLGKPEAKPSEAKPPEIDSLAQAIPEPEIDAADPRRIFAFADQLERSGVMEPQAVPAELETWIAFSLAGEVFALPVTPVREVVRVSSITRVPHAPRPIRGVTNRRGRVIPVIDLRLRIELPAADLGRASRVIVVSSRGRLLGLLVDAVHQVVHIDVAKVQPPPDDVMTVQSDYLSGVYHLDDQLILLVDIDRVLIIKDGVADVAKAKDHRATAEAPAGPT